MVPLQLFPLSESLDTLDLDTTLLLAAASKPIVIFSFTSCSAYLCYILSYFFFLLSYPSLIYYNSLMRLLDLSWAQIHQRRIPFQLAI